jgi:acetyl esterase/lipase
MGALRASLLVSPRPTALLVRRVFKMGGARTAASLERHAPEGLTVLRDQEYGLHPDQVLDVVHPATVDTPLPLVIWVHGGGWVGGSKDELTGYFRLLASHGYVVAGPRYSLAPNHRYPTPARQLMRALEFLQTNAERLHLDPGRIVIAGDSAGAHIAAQLGSLVTTPGYAATVGVPSTITPSQLRGLVLACGIFDLALTQEASTPTGQRLMNAILWAYSGSKGYLDDPEFATWSVTDHLTRAYPPCLITVGNGDPLRAHSERLAERLRALGQEPDTVFWPAEHEPRLNHEYQFDLDTEPAQQFLHRTLTFLAKHLSPQSHQEH